MPGQLIDKPNPPPEVSLIPQSVLSLAVQLDTKDYLDKDDLEAVQSFRRAADYIAAGMYSLYMFDQRLTLTLSNDIPRRQRPPGRKTDSQPHKTSPFGPLGHLSGSCNGIRTAQQNHS